MLVQRRRRWVNIKPTLDQFLAFAVIKLSQKYLFSIETVICVYGILGPTSLQRKCARRLQKWHESYIIRTVNIICIVSGVAMLN